MRARRLLHVLAVCTPIALIGSCGGSVDSDEPSDGGHDSSPSDVAHDAAHDPDAEPDAADSAETDAGDAAQPDAACVCPVAAPKWEEPCGCHELGCTYCNAAKWELTTATCKGGKWHVMVQWDTPCGDN